jgi:hypothetical protein
MADPYRSVESPDRIDARRLLETNPEARAIHDMMAHLYLKGTLTVAEIRIIVTMGLERGMMLETNPMRIERKVRP